MMKRPEEILRAAADHLKTQFPAMSLHAVAARMKISPGYWSKILKGQSPVPQKLLPGLKKVLMHG